MAKGFFDYIADDTTATEPAFEWEEKQEDPAPHNPAEIARDAKGILAEMIADNAPLSDLIIKALQEVGELTNDKAWADKQCEAFMQKLTPEGSRALDLLALELQARDLEKQEKAIIAQIKRQQTKHKAIGTRLEEIAAVANWQGEILSEKDLYTPADGSEGAQDPDGEQMTIPGTM
jgi:hypothetical protein